MTLTVIYALARKRDGFAPVTAESLAKILDGTHSAVRRHIRTLEAHGYIERGHQYEHNQGVGGCPWDGCYGIYVAMKSPTQVYPWASDSGIETLQWRDDVELLTCGEPSCA